MILSVVLSKAILSACLFEPEKPLEPRFYSTSLKADFLIDKAVPIITEKEIKSILKNNFKLDKFQGDIYLTSIDKDIYLPQLEGVLNVKLADLPMGFNYILVNFDADFVKQYECNFEDRWDEILTRLNYGIKQDTEILEQIDKELIYKALEGVIENTMFVYSNPFNNLNDDELSSYLKGVLKDLPEFNSRMRLIQINYDQDLKYFALSVALNLSGIDTHRFFKENSLPSDVNIFNLKGLKNYKIFKNDEAIQENIKPDKVLTASTNRSDKIRFSSSSLKVEVTDSVLYMFDNREKENEKK